MKKIPSNIAHDIESTILATIIFGCVSEINLANKRISSYANNRDFNHANKQTPSSFRLWKRPAVTKGILPEVPVLSDRDFALLNAEKNFEPSYFRLGMVS